MTKPKRKRTSVDTKVVVTFCRNVREARKRQGLTQSQLAQRARLDFRHLQQIETKPPDLRLATAANLAGALSIPLADLLADADEPPRHRLDALEEVGRMLSLPILITEINGLITFCNDAFTKLVGWPREQIVGTLRGRDFLMTEGERFNISVMTEKFVAERAPPPPYETEIRHKDGHAIPIVLHWTHVADALDRFHGMFGVIVTSRTK